MLHKWAFIILIEGTCTRAVRVRKAFLHVIWALARYDLITGLGSGFSTVEILPTRRNCCFKLFANVP